jgi:hypothetical protein
MRSHPITGTSRCSELSEKVTLTAPNGQTTWAFVTTKPPSIRRPLPERFSVLMKATEGEMRAKMSATVTRAGVGVAVAVAVEVGVGVADGVGLAVLVGAMVGDGEGVGCTAAEAGVAAADSVSSCRHAAVIMNVAMRTAPTMAGR